MKLKKVVKVITFLLILGGFFFIYKNIDFNKYKDNNEIVDIKREEKIKSAKLTMVGDLLYEQPYYNALDSGEDINKYTSLVKEYFQKDDLTIGNMEVVISDGELEISGVGYSFCAPQKIGEQVIDMGFDVLSTANNHSNDRGMKGRISTINYFEENSDILTVGTYEEKRDVTKNIKEVNGIKFGFLSYTYGTNVRVEKDLRYSLGLYRDPETKEINDEYKKMLKEEVETLKELVDCIIVLVHWGKEFTYEKIEEQTFLANYLNELGVDIIVGGHSHSIQPIEWIEKEGHKTLVYYSLGNFVSADPNITRTGETFNNAYQFGILSNLVVSLKNEELSITDIKTEPIINYYDTNMKNFMLIPYNKYDEEFEKTHYRYQYNFNKEFISSTFKKVIDSEFR